MLHLEALIHIQTLTSATIAQTFLIKRYIPPSAIPTIPIHAHPTNQPIHLRALLSHLPLTDIKLVTHFIFTQLFLQASHQAVIIPTHPVHPLFVTHLQPGEIVRCKGPQDDFSPGAYAQLICFICLDHKHATESVNPSGVLEWVDSDKEVVADYECGRGKWGGDWLWGKGGGCFSYESYY